MMLVGLDIIVVQHLLGMQLIQESVQIRAQVGAPAEISHTRRMDQTNSS